MTGPVSDALVVFQPSGRRGRFALGTPLLDAARRLGVYVESVCGGRGICGRCQVVPVQGVHTKDDARPTPAPLSKFSDVEHRYATRRSLPPDRRLSCQARINGDLVVDVPTDTAVTDQVVRKRIEARDITRDPAIALYTFDVPPADMDHPIGALERTLLALQAAHAVAVSHTDAHVLRQLPAALGKASRRLTLAVHADDGEATLIGVWPGERVRALGLACDIGSTTIACHLVDLQSGETLASAGTANPQIRFGEDLMSRVSYVMLNPEGLGQLTDVVRAAVNMLIQRLAHAAGVTGADVLDAVFVGNPIMHHVFLGIDPTALGQAPFELAVSGAVTVSAGALGIDVHPGARAYLLPCIAGHVGADAAAVALAEVPDPATEPILIVDVGTNAEILLARPGAIFATSSPTGPAFEGAEISAGQRAAPGAIERVRIDPVTLEPRIKVIGSHLWSDEPGFADTIAGTGVTGICGSGIIEALAEMVLAGLITADGVIDGAFTQRTPRLVATERTFAYRLWSQPHDLMITQRDVRAIQLAKGALYAGARLLMDRAGVAHVARIKLAGAFGSHIDPLYAMIIGLIPDCDPGNVSAVGNAAGTGARMALLNRDHRRTIEALVRRIDKIETALEPRFQEHFVSAMAFPNAIDAFPQLAKVVQMPARPSMGIAPRRRPRRVI